MLLASLFFCLSFGADNFVLIAVYTVCSYFAGRMLERLKDKKSSKKIFYLFCIAALILGLVFYKYFHFVVQNVFACLPGVSIPEKLINVELLLPVGISFYTFQVMAYLTDIYRGTMKAETDFCRYALLICFFPKLTSGPLVKSTDFLEQLREGRSFVSQQVQRGLLLMLLGFFEKIVIADTAMGIVVKTWEQYGQLHAIYLWISAFLYSICIYCDFSGYSHIAIGAAAVFGIRIPDNFTQPYFATSVKDFWQRWHISLSSWLREYIYIPLGGNRRGTLRKYINILIVFTISGIWHGAGWHFVLWGVLHGVYQVAEGMLSGVFKGKKFADDRAVIFLKQVKTFVLVTIAWIFFYSPSLTQGVHYVYGMLTQWGIKSQESYLTLMGMDIVDACILLIALVVVFAADVLREKGRAAEERLCRTGRGVRWCVCLVICLVIFLVLFRNFGQDARGFVYFQF